MHLEEHEFTHIWLWRGNNHSHGLLNQWNLPVRSLPE